MKLTVLQLQQLVDHAVALGGVTVSRIDEHGNVFFARVNAPCRPDGQPCGYAVGPEGTTWDDD